MIVKNFFGLVFAKFRPKGAKEILSLEKRSAFHWKIILTLFLLTVVAVCASSFLNYRNINRKDFSLADIQINPDSGLLKPDLLAKTVAVFKTKAAAFEKSKENWTASVDPSR